MSTNYQRDSAVTRRREVELGMENLLSVEQVAQRLGVSFWTVYRLARSGRLSSVRLGRRRLFTERDLEQLIREGRNCQAEPGRGPKKAGQ